MASLPMVTGIAVTVGTAVAAATGTDVVMLLLAVGAIITPTAAVSTVGIVKTQAERIRGANTVAVLMAKLKITTDVDQLGLRSHVFLLRTAEEEAGVCRSRRRACVRAVRRPGTKEGVVDGASDTHCVSLLRRPLLTSAMEGQLNQGRGSGGKRWRARQLMLQNFFC